jgi:hypothetical protein
MIESSLGKSERGARRFYKKVEISKKIIPEQ